MAKQTGLGDRLLIDGNNLSGDVGSLGAIGGGNEPQTVTGIDKSGIERLGGLRDGRIEFTAFFNPGTGQAHPVLSALPTADVVATYLRGTSLGGPAACLVAKQIGYNPSRGDDGSLTFSVEAQANGFGLEWATQLTAGERTDTGATDGDGVDNGASTSHGLQAYLQVVSFTGTDATIALQESADDGSGDAYSDVTGGTFTQVTAAPTSERIATGSQTVEQWLRVATSTTGGFSELIFVVVVARNPVAVTF